MDGLKERAVVDSYVPFGGLTFALTSEKVVHEREVYNFLDFLGDVGGLFDGLYYFGAFFVWLFGCIIDNRLTKNIVLNVFSQSTNFERANYARSSLRFWLFCF